MKQMTDEEFLMTQACVGASLVVQGINREGLFVANPMNSSTGFWKGLHGAFDRLFESEARTLISAVLVHVLTLGYRLSDISKIEYLDGYIHVSQHTQQVKRTDENRQALRM